MTAPTVRDIVSQLLPLEQHLAKDGFRWKELAENAMLEAKALEQRA